MSLLILQRDLRTWLEVGDDAAADQFAPSARSGLAIYQNNYRAQLASCLEESFPVTMACLGGEAFHAAVVAHVEHSPPSSWTLDHYPRGFPATIARLYPDDPEVGDLVMLELALAEAFVAPGSLPLEAELDTIDWDHATFDFRASLSIHPLRSNAPAIWSAMSAGHPPPPPARLSTTGALLVWRLDEDVRFRATDHCERHALATLMTRGSTFGALCAAEGAEQIEQLGLWLGQWLADQLITTISAEVAQSDQSGRGV